MTLAALLGQQDPTINGPMELVRATMQNMDILHHPNELLDALGQVPFIAATMLVIVGLLCVFNGYRWHKWVVVVLAFLCGLGMGQVLSEQFGRSSIVAVALGGLCAIIATPLVKLAVAVFSGLTGAFIGANIWTALNSSSPDLNWAGAAMGFIALAMASLLLFRLVTVLFTSVGGAAMFVFGVLTLMLQVEAWEPTIRNSFSSNHLLLPIIVMLAAVGGFVLQETRSRAEAAKEEEG
jgi:hypothetical protein